MMYPSLNNLFHCLLLAILLPCPGWAWISAPHHRLHSNYTTEVSMLMRETQVVGSSGACGEVSQLLLWQSSVSLIIVQQAAIQQVPPSSEKLQLLIFYMYCSLKSWLESEWRERWQPCFACIWFPTGKWSDLVTCRWIKDICEPETTAGP